MVVMVAMVVIMVVVMVMVMSVVMAVLVHFLQDVRILRVLVVVRVFSLH